MGWWSRLREYDGEIVDRSMLHEYGRYVQLWCLYPDLDKIGPVLGFLFTVAVIFVNGLLLIITACVSLGHVTVFSEALHFLPLVIIAFTALIHFFTHRRAFAKVHWHIGVRFFVYEDLDEETERIERETRKYKKAWLIFWPVYMGTCAVFLVILAPMIDYYLSDGRQLDEDIPPGVNVHLPLSCWTPYDSSSGFPYYFTVALQFSVSFLAAGVISSADIIYITMAQNTCSQLSILKMAIGQLERRAARFAKLSTADFQNAGFMRCYEYCLKQNIKHHQTIIEYFKSLSETGDNIVFVAFVTGGAMIAAAGVFIVSTEHKIGPIVTTLMFSSGEVFNMFILCWFGEKMNHLSNEIRREIYYSRWYMCSKSIKSSVGIIQESTGRPLTLLAGGIIPAKMETFANILNASYSYFNLLFAFN